MEHPVGTGPFRLAQWRRSSRSCSSATRASATSSTTSSPPPTTPMARPPSRSFKGRRAADDRPRRGQHHRGAAAALAGVPQRRAGPHRAGAGGVRRPVASRTASSRPTSPSAASTRLRYAAHRRRACRTSTWRTRSSAATRRRRSRCGARSRWPTTSTREIRLVRRGQAIPAQSLVAPLACRATTPTFRSEMSDFDRGARAGAARPLRLRRPRRRRLARAARRPAAGARVRDRSPTDLSRQLDELWKKNMDAIGIRIVLQDRAVAREAEGSRAPASCMMWRVGSSAATPTARSSLDLGYGPRKGKGNLARFDLRRVQPRCTSSMQRAARRPRAAGAVIDAGAEAAGRLHAVQGARAPHLHRPAQPWVVGYRPHAVLCATGGSYVDIDPPSRRGTA